MDSQEVIQSISSIYDRFEVPHNLRMHMYRAGAIAELVCDNWTGPQINKNDIIATSLIHDLGNIVRFDLETPVGRSLLDKDQLNNLDGLKKLRDRIRERYGTKDLDVTKKMAEELGVSDRLMFILEHGSQAFADQKLLESEDWDFKIHAYTDFRVGPFGIMTLKERFEEYRKRKEAMIRAGGTKSWTYTHLDEIMVSAIKLEKEIIAYSKLSAEEINDASVQPYLDKYLKNNA
jgi:hypothetical protein